MVKKRSQTISQSPVCSQRISEQSSAFQDKGGRCESQVDSDVEVGESNVSVDTQIDFAQVRPFKAGRIKEYLVNWQKITSDDSVLGMV